MLAKYAIGEVIYVHSNFIDIVLLYRQVCSLLMPLRNTLEKFCTEKRSAVDDRPEETVSKSLILINIMYLS